MVETYLISPPIYLVGGNQATLRFWHSFDFSSMSDWDLEQSGTVNVMSTDGSTMTPVGSFGIDEFSNGWEQVPIDLTGHLGEVFHLVWQYVLVSFDFENTFSRPGWLVDDVEVTVETIVPGTLQVSNNLAQAAFTLSGPTRYTGQGKYFTVTNAPPGQYVLAYSEVQFYQTPPSQTNTLAAGATLLFQAAYTFPDANTNGISDLWEQHFFGVLSTNRTLLTDSDQDGMSDYAEFLAGTDPTSPASRLALAPPLVANSMLVLQWPSVPNRAYRLLRSDDLAHWSPLSDWVRAPGTTLRQTLSLPAPGFYRIEVTP